MKLPLILIAFWCIPAWSWSAVAREWTDSSGKHRIQADFLDFQDGHVRLEKTDGNIISVPIERFSTSDQQWVKERLRELQRTPARAPRDAARKQRALEQLEEFERILLTVPNENDAVAQQRFMGAWRSGLQIGVVLQTSVQRHLPDAPPSVDARVAGLELHNNTPCSLVLLPWKDGADRAAALKLPPDMAEKIQRSRELEVGPHDTVKALPHKRSRVVPLPYVSSPIVDTVTTRSWMRIQAKPNHTDLEPIVLSVQLAYGTLAGTIVSCDYRLAMGEEGD